MLRDWDKQTPGRVDSIMGALKNIAPSQLADRELFNFTDLQIDRSQEKKAYGFADTETVSRKNEDMVRFVEVMDEINSL
jgi:tRNA 2-thiocytidine biosynthesis protein TtcA